MLRGLHGRDQDQNWLRQLFTPTFIVWLDEWAGGWLGFELVDGTLCCYVRDYLHHHEDLDYLCEASAAIATRLREESLE